MKNLFLILGGILCLGLIVAAMYVGLTIGLSHYIAYSNNARWRAYQAKQAQQQAQQTQQSIASWGKNMEMDSMEKKWQAEAADPTKPTLFVDPDGYDNEDNWLATGIAREIAEMAAFASRPDAPALTVKATVDPGKPTVHVEIAGLGGASPLTSDLTPTFAWDPEGYAALATQVLGATPVAASTPASDQTDVLGNLLNLTGKNLAKEDVRLSANLQLHPASWPDHEAAALVLAALALREEGGSYADNRTMLNRATAHLALAQALRGNQPATWPGLVADAAVRTLAGRELDALARLDALAARPDVPESAKPWLAALRLLAKQDWRAADVTAQSPLVLKIVWFKILCRDLTSDVALDRLPQIVPQPPADAGNPASAPQLTPEMLIPDWARIVGRNPFSDLDPEDTKNAGFRLNVEFHEMDVVMRAEGDSSFDLDHLAAIYSEPETDTISRDALGKAVVRVVGLGTFKASSRRHVFAALLTREPYPDPGANDAQDPAEAQNVFTKYDIMFQGVPGYDFARLHTGFVDGDAEKRQYDEWISQKISWPIWEVPFSLAENMPGYGRVEKFYRRAVPFGTVYDPARRYSFINDVDPETYPLYDTPELEKIKQLPPDQAMRELPNYNQRYNELLHAQEPKGPKPFEQQLLKLAPDDYLLAQDHVPNDKLITAAARFLDYNLNPVGRIESLDEAHLSQQDRIAILRKHVAMEPDFGFRAGVVLRGYGLDDEAAEMERKAFASGANPIGISNSVMPLVDYDLRHGQNDEALKVAKFAGDVASENGLSIYTYALEKLGRLDEAEAVARQDSQAYSDPMWLHDFQLRHRDRYPQVYADALQADFPGGLVAAKLADFSGTPGGGAQIRTDSDTLKVAHLQPGDVIVALDGYKVGSEAQYYFVRALSADPGMDFIVWRGGNYFETKATIPARRMMVDLGDYPGQ
jgi:hypothetical protein